MRRAVSGLQAGPAFHRVWRLCCRPHPGPSACPAGAPRRRPSCSSCLARLRGFPALLLVGGAGAPPGTHRLCFAHVSLSRGVLLSSGAPWRACLEAAAASRELLLVAPEALPRPAAVGDAPQAQGRSLQVQPWPGRAGECCPPRALRFRRVSEATLLGGERAEGGLAGAQRPERGVQSGNASAD